MAPCRSQLIRSSALRLFSFLLTTTRLISASHHALTLILRQPQRLLLHIGHSALFAWPILTLIGIALGISVVHQLHYQFGNAIDTTLKWLAYLMLFELAPLFSSLLLLARNGVACANQFAPYQLNSDNEIKLASLIGVRQLAYALSGCGLAIYLAVASLIAGIVYAKPRYLLTEWQQLLGQLPLSLWLSLPCKTVVFCSVITWCCCLAGLFSSRRRHASLATSRAVFSSLTVIFLFDGLWAIFWPLNA